MAKKRPGGKGPRFVVHKHDASTLHYDFRLEVGDEGADRRRNLLSSQPKSVLSGRTIEELAQ